MRDVDARLAWFLAHRPAAAGRCAEYTWHALGGPDDPPRQGLPDATAVARLVQQLGHMRTGPCPRGAFRYWVGGSDGHGHVGIEHAPLNDPAAVASTDVDGPRTVGVRPFSWFGRNWPELQYVGWSWYWGRFNTQPKEPPMPAGNVDYHYSGKPAGTLAVARSYVTLDVAPWDPPRTGELQHTLVYLNVRPTKWAPGKTIGSLRVRLARADNDMTGYHDHVIAVDALAGDGRQLITHPYWEAPDGKPIRVQVRCQGGLLAAEVGTRYVKHAVIVD